MDPDVCFGTGEDAIWLKNAGDVFDYFNQAALLAMVLAEEDVAIAAVLDYVR